MELVDHKLVEKSVTQSMFLSNNYSNNPSMKDGFFFEAAPSSSSKGGFLQDFRNLDQFNANGSCLNPMFEVQTGSNFDSFDAFPYGSSTNMDFYDYECKPFADNNNNGQVMLPNGGHLLNRSQRNNPIDIIGLNNVEGDMSLSFPEIKPINFVVPDEVSCVTAYNNNEYCKNNAVVNKNNRVSASTRRTWKGRKNNNVVKGQWTADEDRLLSQLVEQYGIRKWSHIAQMLPGRIGKQCRERWHNHLRPDIKKEIWNEEEDKVLIQAHAEIGNKWAEIAKRLPGRTENSIKNHWNATKRRQYSKRKCRSKYPRGSLLQDYIKSLNLDLDSFPAGSSYNNIQGKSCATAINSTMKSAQNYTQPQELVPNYEVPDFEFDEKIMFQEGCSFDSLLDEIPCDDHHQHNNHVVDEKSFEMDVAPLMMDFEVKKELDLVEMISQANM